MILKAGEVALKKQHELTTLDPPHFNARITQSFFYQSPLIITYLMGEITNLVELELQIAKHELNWKRCKNDYGFVRNSVFAKFLENIEITHMLKNAKKPELP